MMFPMQTCMLRGEIETIKVHHFGPGCHEVVDKLLLGVRTSIDLGQSTELGVRTEDEIDTRAGPPDFASLAISAFKYVPASDTAFHSVLMSSRLVKKSLVSASGLFVKTPCRVCPKLVFSTRMPPTSTVISGAVRVSSCALSTSNSSADTHSGDLRSCGSRPPWARARQRRPHRSAPARRPCVPV